jgi:hypothetical protein
MAASMMRTLPPCGSREFIRERCFALAIAACALLCIWFSTPALGASTPYASLPSINDNVRFDGSAGGEKSAWAYPNQNLLEQYLRSTIDASFGSSSYEAYERKMSSVLSNSLDFPNGTPAQVMRVWAFAYRGRQDAEVQLRITSGPFHAVVWTTPAELVSSSGHRYLR